MKLGHDVRQGYEQSRTLNGSEKRAYCGHGKGRPLITAPAIGIIFHDEAEQMLPAELYLAARRRDSCISTAVSSRLRAIHGSLGNLVLGELPNWQSSGPSILFPPACWPRQHLRMKTANIRCGLSAYLPCC